MIRFLLLQGFLSEDKGVWYLERQRIYTGKEKAYSLYYMVGIRSRS